MPRSCSTLGHVGGRFTRKVSRKVQKLPTVSRRDPLHLPCVRSHLVESNLAPLAPLDPEIVIRIARSTCARQDSLVELIASRSTALRAEKEACYGINEKTRMKRGWGEARLDSAIRFEMTRRGFRYGTRAGIRRAKSVRDCRNLVRKSNPEIERRDRETVADRASPLKRPAGLFSFGVS